MKTLIPVLAVLMVLAVGTIVSASVSHPYLGAPLPIVAYYPPPGPVYSYPAPVVTIVQYPAPAGVMAPAAPLPPPPVAPAKIYRPGHPLGNFLRAITP